MQIQEIEVVIDKNSEVTIHVSGIKGERCLELTKALEQALGADVVSRELTAEAFEQDQTYASVHVEQRTSST